MHYQISGHSMYPLLKDGEVIQIKPLHHRTSTVKPGDVVVFQHPFRNIECVKQVRKINPDGTLTVAGTTIESEDAIGSINTQDIVGLVTSTIFAIPFVLSDSVKTHQLRYHRKRRKPC